MADHIPAAALRLNSRPQSPVWAELFGPPATPPASRCSYLLDQLASGAELAPPDPLDADLVAPEDADEAAALPDYDGPCYDELPWWTFR